MPIFVYIAFAYTTDPLVQAALKEFHVYASDPTTHARLGTVIIVPKTAIPTLTSPLSVPMTAYGTQAVEVVAVDLQGKEGIKAFAPMYVPLPAASGIAQVTG